MPRVHVHWHLHRSAGLRAFTHDWHRRDEARERFPPPSARASQFGFEQEFIVVCCLLLSSYLNEILASSLRSKVEGRTAGDGFMEAHHVMRPRTAQFSD